MDARSIKVYRLSSLLRSKPEDELPVEIVDY